MHPSEEKNRLIDYLNETREDLLVVLKDVPKDRIVYADSGWRVKDIIGHLTMWEQHALTALQAYRNGGSFVLDYQDEDQFNQAEIEQRRDLSFEVLYEDWITVRDELKNAVNDCPLELFGKTMMHPWQLSGTLSSLIESMAVHEREHTQAIQAACG
jgi:hypothetical protein